MLEDATGKRWLATRTGIYVIGKDGGAQHIPMGDRLQNVRAASPLDWSNIDGFYLILQGYSSLAVTGFSAI